MKPLIVIPTYNEAENLPRLIPEIFAAAPAAAVLVVDDNSPDGTGEIAAELSARYPERVFLLRREAKTGLATAYIEGFSWGLQREYTHFIEMDADFSHDPRFLPALLAAAERHDFCVGSRNIPGGAVVGWSFWRNLVSKGGSLYAHIVLGCPIRDLSGGFNLWSRQTLERIGLSTIISRGYSFQLEMKYRAWRNRQSFTEVPIVFPDRQFGKSKMSWKIFCEAFINVIKLRFAKV